MVSHYDAATAFGQKVGALAGRRETQARDVFDLHQLLAAGGAAGAVEERDPRVAGRAIANAMTVDFGMFKSQGRRPGAAEGLQAPRLVTFGTIGNIALGACRGLTEARSAFAFGTK